MKINDKHIEVIVRQMLQKVEITDGGDTTLLPGEQVDYEEMDEINAKLAEGQLPAQRQAGAARHHQGARCRPVQLHLGRLVPGDHPRPHARRRSQGKKDTLIGPQGERDRRPPDPGRHRRGHEPPARHRLQARRGAPRLAAALQPRSSPAPNSAAEEHAAELARSLRDSRRHGQTIRWVRSAAPATAPMRMPASI